MLRNRKYRLGIVDGDISFYGKYLRSGMQIATYVRIEIKMLHEHSIDYLSSFLSNLLNLACPDSIAHSKFYFSC